MRRLLWLFTLAPLFAAYQPFQTDTFTSYPGSQWTVTGTVTPTTAGLNINSAWNSSVISTVPVPDGTADYEVRMTLRITQSGGVYMAYVRSTPDASVYYTVALMDVTLNGSSCSGTLTIWKVQGGAWLMASALVPCHDGMNIRAVMKGTWLYAFTDNLFRFAMNDGGLAGGLGGVGGRAMPSGNTISKVEIGPADRIAPNAVDPRTIRNSPSANCIDLAFQPPSDDVNGTGVQAFHLTRNGVVIGAPYDGGYSDCGLTPGTTYNYEIRSIDYHSNFSAPAAFTATTPPAGTVDSRRIGVHALGSYWGSGGEQVDMRSGNLNFSIPLLKAQGRGGWGVTFALSYNSQLWRQDSGGVWKLGADTGFGYGWRLLAGSVMPYWTGATSLAYFVYTDSSGAEYKLDQNSGNVWTSREGIYVSYDANTQTLWFPDGMRWVMGCTSAGTEQDAGTMYPTTMQDSNGNQILMRYQSGVGTGWTNSSARITDIEDVRAPYSVYGNSTTYHFYYTTDALPHWTGLGNTIGTGESFPVVQYGDYALTDPFVGSSYGAVKTLVRVQNALSQAHLFEYGGNSGPAELSKVTFPYGAYFRYEYRNSSHSPTSILREIDKRYLSASPGASEQLYSTWFYLTIGNSFHQYTGVIDPTNAFKRWEFNSAGLTATYNELLLPNWTLYRGQTYSWNTTGNAYLASVITSLENGQQMKTEQTVDADGNVTERKVYDYGQGSPGALMRTYTTSFVTDGNYTSRYMRNRVLSGTVTQAGQPTLTLVQLLYDQGFLLDRPTVRHWALPGTTVRGNVTRRTAPGSVRNMLYDNLGMVYQTDDGNGHTLEITPDASKDYAVPAVITPFNSATLATSMTWNSFLGLTQETGPNGASSAATYDGNARPQTSTSPHGASTTYEYNDTERWTKATTNGRWSKTTKDGLGRTVKVEAGDASGTKSVVDSEYAACACSPLGKLWRVSQPHAPAAAAVWTTYTYDPLGRTTRVTLPDGSHTDYAYTGNTVQMTDAAGKWKRYTIDGVGNLVKVTEPVVGDTTYTYDAVNHLTQVAMTRDGVTQTRTFVYDGATQRLSSATNPETGTVTYAYNADGTLQSKTDAKGQRIQSTYDDKQRVTQVSRFNGQTETLCDRQVFTYDTEDAFTLNAKGRVAKESWGGETCAGGSFSHTYSYTAAGLRTKKRLDVVREGETAASINGQYGYDNEGRLTSGDGFTYVYDTMGRTSQMRQQVDDTLFASATYGVAGEMLTMSWSGGFSPNNYITETRTYNEHLQLTRQRAVSMFGLAGLDVEYRFPAGTNNGRISSQKENVSGEEITYQYDELNRLIAAVTTGPEWGLSFAYDGFGNRTAQTVTKGTAPQVTLAYNGTTNRISTPGWSYDANGNVTAMPTASLAYDGYNRLSWSGPSTEYYAYAPDNKRVWRDIVGEREELTYYNVAGQRITTYRLYWSGGSWSTQPISTNIYFTGRLIWTAGQPVVTDRLGSVRRRMDPDTSYWGEQLKYFPYGEEQVTTASNKEKFGTYTRDQRTNLDYANQRYYSSGFGRFLTPDPSQPGASMVPQSWNYYGYTQDDPVNTFDPTGLNLAMTICIDGGCSGDGGGMGGWEAVLGGGGGGYILTTDTITTTGTINGDPFIQTTSFRDVTLLPGSPSLGIGAGGGGGGGGGGGRGTSQFLEECMKSVDERLKAEEADFTAAYWIKWVTTELPLAIAGGIGGGIVVGGLPGMIEGAIAAMASAPLWALLRFATVERPYWLKNTLAPLKKELTDECKQPAKQHAD